MNISANTGDEVQKSNPQRGRGNCGQQRGIGKRVELSSMTTWSEKDIQGVQGKGLNNHKIRRDGERNN